MPTYDYDCGACGPFEARRAVAERDEPAACPRCGLSAARLFAGAARLRLMDSGARRSIEAHERALGDGAYRTLRHPLGCGCCRA